MSNDGYNAAGAYIPGTQESGFHDETSWKDMDVDFSGANATVGETALPNEEPSIDRLTQDEPMIDIIPRETPDVIDIANSIDTERVGGSYGAALEGTRNALNEPLPQIVQDIPSPYEKGVAAEQFTNDLTRSFSSQFSGNETITATIVSAVGLVNPGEKIGELVAAQAREDLRGAALGSNDPMAGANFETVPMDGVDVGAILGISLDDSFVGKNGNIDDIDFQVTAGGEYALQAKLAISF